MNTIHLINNEKKAFCLEQCRRQLNGLKLRFFIPGIPWYNSRTRSNKAQLMLAVCWNQELLYDLTNKTRHIFLLSLSLPSLFIHLSAVLPLPLSLLFPLSAPAFHFIRFIAILIIHTRGTMAALLHSTADLWHLPNSHYIFVFIKHHNMEATNDVIILFFPRK